MNKVVALPEVRLYLKSLPTRFKKPAPAIFNRWGKDMYYVTFRKNYHTQWYVFFNIYHVDGESVYLIRYISNNHVVSQFL